MPKISYKKNVKKLRLENKKTVLLRTAVSIFLAAGNKCLGMLQRTGRSTVLQCRICSKILCRVFERRASGNRVSVLSVKSLIRAVISLSVLSFILMQIDLGVLRAALLDFNLLYFGFGIVFILVQIFFLNIRWHVLVNCGRVKLPFKTNVLINLASYFANVFFIASVGSVVAKSVLPVRHGVPLFHAMVATFFDRFMTIFALIVFGAVGLGFLHGVVDEKILLILGACIFFLMVGLAIAIVFIHSEILRPFILASRRRAKAAFSVRKFVSNFSAMFWVLGCSLCAQACFFVSVYVMSLGVTTHAHDMVVFLALLPILALISSLPISFGGWGVREGAFIYGLGLIGIPMADAFMLSVQVGLVGLVAPMIYALPYLLDDQLANVVLKADKESKVSV